MSAPENFDFGPEVFDYCPNCCGDGVVYLCLDEIGCVDPEGGCDLCERRCDWCRPRRVSASDRTPGVVARPAGGAASLAEHGEAASDTRREAEQ